jgi:hypothetical protein
VGLQEQAEQRARAQVVEERAGTARELRDIVAHNRSLITMRASVAGYVGDSQPEEAVRALAVIEDTGRGALHEMLRLHGMLRDSDGIPQTPSWCRTRGWAISTSWSRGRRRPACGWT